MPSTLQFTADGGAGLDVAAGPVACQGNFTTNPAFRVSWVRRRQRSLSLVFSARLGVHRWFTSGTDWVMAVGVRLRRSPLAVAPLMRNTDRALAGRLWHILILSGFAAQNRCVPSTVTQDWSCSFWSSGDLPSHGRCEAQWVVKSRTTPNSLRGLSAGGADTRRAPWLLVIFAGFCGQSRTRKCDLRNSQTAVFGLLPRPHGRSGTCPRLSPR